MKKLFAFLLLLVGCKEIVYVDSQDFLVIVEASPNTEWVGKIDTFTVSSKVGQDIYWFSVNRPGVCWEIRKGANVKMIRAYGTTPDFTYGYNIEANKYKIWGDMNTNDINGVVRGCIPPDAKY